MTPGSKLKINISRRLKREDLSGKFKILVQEDGGKCQKNYLSARYTPPTSSCARPECFPCSSHQASPKPKTSGNHNCWTRSCTYSITCLPCQQEGKLTQYWGESGHSGFTGGKSHKEGLRLRSKNSVLHNHAVKEHGGAKHTL